jgi:hypothetical protein
MVLLLRLRGASSGRSTFKKVEGLWVYEMATNEYGPTIVAVKGIAKEFREWGTCVWTQRQGDDRSEA